MYDAILFASAYRHLVRGDPEKNKQQTRYTDEAYQKTTQRI